MLKLTKDKATTLALMCLYEDVPLTLIEKARYVMEEAYIMGHDDAEINTFVVGQDLDLKLCSSQVGYLEHFCQETKISEKYVDKIIAISETAYDFGTIDCLFGHKKNQSDYDLDLGDIVHKAIFKRSA
jgi:hypothetical protein